MRNPLCVLALPALLASCGDSTGVQPDDLAGTWTATSFVFQSVATPALQVDVVDEQDLTITATIQSSGDVSLTITGTGINETSNGTLTVTGSNFTLVLDGDTSTGTISRDGDVLTLTFTSGLEFDFDQDGTDEPATGTAVFQKA